MFSIGLKFPVPAAKIPASKKPLRHFSEIGSLVRFQLKLQFVSDQSNEFRARVFSPLALAQRFLLYSSAATTQRYIGIKSRKIEQAIQNRANLR